MYSLLCTPIITIPQNAIAVEKCRIVSVTPTDTKNTYVMTLVNAPPINVLPPKFTVDEIDKSDE